MDYYRTRVGSEEIVQRKCELRGGKSYVADGLEVISDAIPVDKVNELQAFAINAKDGTDFKSPEISGGVRSVLGFHRKLEWLTSSDTIKGFASSILGDDFYIHQSRINYKSGTSTGGWRWHSDFETWHYSDGMPGMNCFTMMIPLQQNTPFNGPLTVIPGSHKKYVRCAAAEDVDHCSEFSSQTAGLPSDDAIMELATLSGYRQILCSPGDIVIFDCNIMHGSAASLDPGGRANMFFVFNARDNSLTKPFGAKKYRPEAMASRVY